MMKERRAQAAIDFLTSYGIALMIIFIAGVVIYNVSISRPALATSRCTGSAGFACESYQLNVNGVLILTLSQATGGTITIQGAACATRANTIGSNPAYGNVNVINALIYNGQNFYTGIPASNNAPGLGINLYSGSSNTLFVYCYNSGGVATGPLGSGYDGFVWLNYTLPGYGNVIQQVAIVSMKYT